MRINEVRRAETALAGCWKKVLWWEKSLKKTGDFVIPAGPAPEVSSPGAGIQSFFELFDF
ncbi:MAG: hypothetical protein ACLP51_10735 [Syntrophobacteraceae bacterium]